ncbi:uncharacterized protein PHALS_09042 [Plasmopara halstedii]|uniref:Uncharacterized protein n=1 Tax=Plasmopara halstedii TaxID=4781 RepID=A0A0P1A5H6_PLAHL|nr:uncharacterized protein PHALS_09042 [Plasmopara halstedii]CEG35230.1 hypothetical protein PHALS_09042 [Plasmopara halstedii]|eukprot:XP_024571599.1 hypothetical protein PHALS_09042 [Plasmopara halstedii]
MSCDRSKELVTSFQLGLQYNVQSRAEIPMKCRSSFVLSNKTITLVITQKQQDSGRCRGRYSSVTTDISSRIAYIQRGQ